MSRRTQTENTSADDVRIETELPAAMATIRDYIDQRIDDIKQAERLTPWNKAKMMAFKEIRDLIEPQAPLPQAPQPEAPLPQAPEGEVTDDVPTPAEGPIDAESQAERVESSSDLAPQPEAPTGTPAEDYEPF